MPIPRRCLVAICVIALSACAPSTPTSAPLPTTIAPSAAPSSTASIPSPSPSPPPSTVPPAVASKSTGATPTLTFAPPSAPRLVVLAQNLPEPDDLVLASDRSILVSDVQDGTVRRIASDGAITTLVSNLQSPEGMVFLPDGSLVIAEQGTNRLLQFDPRTKKLTTFLQLANKTGQLGVDGIAFDSATRTIIVPDSPNGTLLRVNLDGKIISTLARGMARPTGAFVEPSGSILVADENGGSVDRVPGQGGPPQRIGRFSVPDDVIEDGAGNIYVNTMGDNAIHRIDAQTGASTVFWRGLSNPQGIIFDADSNLVIADAGNHRVIKLVMK